MQTCVTCGEVVGYKLPTETLRKVHVQQLLCYMSGSYLVPAA